MDEISRRQFLEFMGKGTLGIAALNLAACSGKYLGLTWESFEGLKPMMTDNLELVSGLNYERLLSWGDKINKKEKFGFNNDYLAYFPLAEDRGILWANHEYVDRVFVSGRARTKANIIKERKEVGGSLVEIKRENGRWRPISNSQYNRRVDANTEFDIIAERPIAGSKTAVGTFGNCAGGVTPWGTVLTCEENVDYYYGWKNEKHGKFKTGFMHWAKYFKGPHEHYGWVVEIDPKTGKGKKLTSMGRFAHECATVRELPDGRCVVYTGDDKNDEHIYKFIASEKGSLEKGELFVANLEEGRWISLDINKQPKLKAHFDDQTEVLIYAREAAKIVGATPTNRPEDFEIHPETGDVYLTLTNNIPRGDFHGEIMKISEDGNDPLSMTFKADTFLAGGEKTGFACPDNLAFDKNGNLWMVTDISGSGLGNGPYKPFGNNGLFYIPLEGPKAGIPIQVASAPMDAELTGICFTPDNETLLLSVQHPGETTKSLKKLKSNWPHGGNEIPKPSVVQIKGPLLNQLLG